MPDPAFAFDGGPLTPLGRQIDDQIAAARVATPVKDVTQRRVPRVSIAELNQMDRDQLHERLRQAVANSDNRGPVQVVLDLIDLPRNLIFNAVAPSIARANKEAGDSAALGLGRVTTSDILKDWGVENSVVRGIAGFVGDVALDPLTYAGPPGWGAKVITKTGSAALRKGGMAAIEAELKAVAAGAKAVNPEARRLVEAAMATKEMSGAERLANLAGTERSVNALRPKVLGEFTNSKLGKAFSKVGLNELESAGGVLSRFDESLSEAAKLGDKVAEEQIGAARGFISKFGKGTEPGLEFGKDATSAVAHIPFTDISLRVPNFTLAGRTAASNLRIARETQQGLHAMAAADGVLRGGLAGSRAANEIPDILRDINEQSRTAQQPVAQTIADLTQEIDKLRGADPTALGTRYPVIEHRGTFADIEKAIGAIDPGTVAGERGAGISKATIDDKLEQMVNGPRATGRGAFLTDNRAAYLSDPENGTKALLAHALREKRAGRYVIGQHGAITGLDPERLHVGDSWRIGDDTLEVLEKGDDGTLTLNWTPSNGESARQVRVGPDLTDVNGSKFKSMLPASEGSFVGALPNADPAALAMRDRLAAATGQLADLRRQQKEAVDSALGLSQLSQELTDTAIQSVTPNGSITSAEQLITLGQLKRQADAAAEYARAQKSIYESGLALRADLYDKWESPTVAASTMSQTRQELFDLANRDPELAEQLSMAYGRAAEANANMAQAIGAQVAQTAANTGDRVLREVAKRALGTSDDLIGTAPMMALSRAAAATLGDQNGLIHILQTADRVNRKAFGNRSGLLAGQQKFWKRILTTGDVAAQDATRQQKILAKALTEAGKSPDARMLEQADQLLSAEVWRLTLNNGAKYHLRDFADPAKPSQLMQVFMDARKDGLYAGERGKELRKSIRSLAEQEVQRLRELGDQELADELLGVTMDSYAPIGLMPDAQRELGRVGAIMGDAGVDKPKAKESFQIQRLTNQTRYTDAEGVRRRFFEGERDFADKVTQGQWQAWKKDGTFPQHILDLSSDARGVPDKAKADGFMQIVDDVKSFDELPEEVRLSSPSLPTDPFELESLRGSRLFWITGGTADKPFFDTRWSTVSSRRLLAHERASARRSMAKLLGAQGIQVRPGSLAKIVPGEEFTTKGGVKGQVIALPNNRTGVRIGDTVFRPVEQSAGINSIFKDAFGSDLHNWIVPEQTAEVVDGIMELGKEPGQLLKLFDHMTGAWRVATLTNPSWITNNMIGNTMLGLQQRLFTPKDIADYSKDAFALHWYRGEPDVLRRMSFDVGGQKVTGEQLWNELQRHNIVGNNLINKEAAAYATADIAPWSRPWETRVRDAFSPGAIQKSMQEIPSDLKYRMQVAADARRAEGAGPNAAVDALRSTVSVGVYRYMRWFGAPFQRLNSVADDSMRTVAYLAARRRGMDGPTAAKAVLDGFIDYGDLTRFESQYLRRIVPFYAWIRNNTAIQFKTLFENPKYAAIAPKLQQAMDEAFAGEQSVPQNMRPRWMQDALAVQLGTDPEKRQALMLMSGLPQEQLYKTLMGVVGVDGFQDMLKYFGNSTHPLFQTFYGVTAGVDPFSGRTIGNSGDMTLPKFLLNQAVPAVPRAEQIIKSTGQGGAGAGFSRFLLGGKVQDFSQQRIDQWNLRELRKAETALRIKVARAERTGDDSLDLRAELLHVYSEMARRGVGLDTIPKWAMEELSAAGVGR